MRDATVFAPSYLILLFALIGLSCLSWALIALCDWVSCRYGRLVPCGPLTYKDVLLPERGEPRHVSHWDEERMPTVI
jgi:hypothetical protein